MCQNPQLHTANYVKYHQGASQRAINEQCRHREKLGVWDTLIFTVCDLLALEKLTHTHTYMETLRVGYIRNVLNIAFLDYM